jgi:hypothetical protein
MNFTLFVVLIRRKFCVKVCAKSPNGFDDFATGCYRRDLEPIFYDLRILPRHFL